MIVEWILDAIKDIKIAIILLTFIAVLMIVKQVFFNSLPPGPWGMPVVGYLFTIQKSKQPLHLQYCKLAKQYGSICSFKLGHKLIVILSDFKIIKKTFGSDEFSGRPHTRFSDILGGYGIVNTDGELWKTERKFLHRKLFGMFSNGKQNFEEKITSEVTLFIQWCASRHGRSTNISYSLGMSISNVICNLIMGVRFHRDDLRFKKFMSHIEEGFKLFAKVSAANYMPFMECWPSVKEVQKQISQNRMDMAQFFQDTIDEQRRTYNENTTRHLVDNYLTEIEQARNENREKKLFEGKNHDRQMQQILGDLFSAGMETVKTTLEWSLLLMMHNPDKAKAVQDELDAVVGRKRLPTFADRPKLPITQATIEEVLRRISVVPLGTTHATTRNVIVNGYTIPAGTEVVPLLYAVNMDSKNWENPEAFEPSRFLNNGEFENQKKPYLPFGTGKRECLGFQLARMELFLYFSSLMHMFDLRPPEGKELPSLRENAGITISPDPFDICLVHRDNLIDFLNNAEVNDVPVRNVGSH
ncbi:cytochrome P450 18a1 [Nylanderia fulva]|uniref:cytochrome P450 18a1 n=1 Tax=Nylanderia fulva TaxID=613905 RepID=UPI0010FB2801|nr:cytochrome P450 18a1 [Nylanderia fulva]